MVRIKYRYLLMNILYPETDHFTIAQDSPSFLRFQAPTPEYIDSGVFIKNLRSQIAFLFGDQGLGFVLPGLKLVYFSNATSTAILRVPRSHFQIVWASLTHITALPAPRERVATATRCVVRVVRVSGTIRKAEEDLLRRSRRSIIQAQSTSTEIQSMGSVKVDPKGDFSVMLPDSDSNGIVMINDSSDASENV